MNDTEAISVCMLMEENKQLKKDNEKLKDVIHKIEVELEDLNAVPWQTKDVLAVALERIDNIIKSLGEKKNEEEN